MRHSTTPVIILFLIAVGIGGFFIGRTNLFNLERQKNQQTKVNKNPGYTTNETDVVLFFLKTAPANFYLKPVLYKVKSNGDLHVQALEALFAGPSKQSGLQPIFSPETKILGFNLKDGIAYVNFNRSVAKLNVGSSGEALAVASIVNTLTKFPDVFKVKFLIEGKEVESLAGHFDLTGFLQYDDQLVDPELF